jgi:nucleoside-triphosphatase THEP1
MSVKKNHSKPEIGRKLSKVNPVFIISGDIAEGKTHFTAKLISELNKQGLKVGGFYSPRVMDGDRTIGYDLIPLSSHERIVFLRENERSRDIGRFSVHPEAFSRARKCLEADLEAGIRLCVIDEVGKWEMKGEGWSHLIAQLLPKEEVTMIWVVRDSFVDQVIQYWNIQHPINFRVKRANPKKAAKKVIKFLK